MGKMMSPMRACVPARPTRTTPRAAARNAVSAATGEVKVVAARAAEEAKVTAPAATISAAVLISAGEAHAANEVAQSAASVEVLIVYLGCLFGFTAFAGALYVFL